MENTNWLWFEENYENEYGRNLRVAIKDVLEIRQSQYQKIEMYETVAFGKMLVLDGVIMLTEYDNYAYHEMIAHVPMISHKNPQRVLIVGGGDGGTLTEILKHANVKEIVLCEIDEEVINISKKYFTSFADSFNNNKVSLIIEDAAKYLATKKDYFDIICVDSSDPIGPAEVLFKEKFYLDIHSALTETGIAVTQSESLYYHTDLIKNLYIQNKKIFKYASYYYTLVPTYPSGTIGFSFCSKKYTPFMNLDENKIAQLKKLNYYSLSIHKASFDLPQFVKRQLD